MGRPPVVAGSLTRAASLDSFRADLLPRDLHDHRCDRERRLRPQGGVPPHDEGLVDAPGFVEVPGRDAPPLREPARRIESRGGGAAAVRDLEVPLAVLPVREPQAARGGAGDDRDVALRGSAGSGRPSARRRPLAANAFPSIDDARPGAIWSGSRSASARADPVRVGTADEQERVARHVRVRNLGVLEDARLDCFCHSRQPSTNTFAFSRQSATISGSFETVPITTAKGVTVKSAAVPGRPRSCGEALRRCWQWRRCRPP